MEPLLEPVEPGPQPQLPGAAPPSGVASKSNVARIGSSRMNATARTAISAPTTPTQYVLAMAIENALWMPSTIVGTNGAIWACCGRRHAGQDPLAKVAGPGEVDGAAAGELATICCGTPAATSCLGISVTRRAGQHRAGDRQPDRATDLLEERQAGGRDADRARG